MRTPLFSTFFLLFYVSCCSPTAASLLRSSQKLETFPQNRKAALHLPTLTPGLDSCAALASSSSSRLPSTSRLAKTALLALLANCSWPAAEFERRGECARWNYRHLLRDDVTEPRGRAEVTSQAPPMRRARCARVRPRCGDSLCHTSHTKPGAAAARRSRWGAGSPRARRGIFLP